MAFSTRYDSDAEGRLREKPTPRVPLDRGLCYLAVAQAPRLFDGWPTVKAYDYFTHAERMAAVLVVFPALAGMPLDGLFEAFGDAVAKRRQDRRAAYARRVMRVME